MLLLSVPLSWVASERYRHRRAVAKIRQVGGGVVYSYYNDAVPPWRRSEALRWLLGKDFISGAYQVGFGPAAITDEELVWLEDLPETYVLILSDNPITDAGLTHLEGFSNLCALHLNNAEITDNGLRHLMRLPNLVSLQLEGTDITDAGLEYLKAMRQLGNVSLSDTHVTDEGVKKLQRALPNCSITTSRGELQPDGEYWQSDTGADSQQRLAR
jgi:hypothetical protein